MRLLLPIAVVELKRENLVIGIPVMRLEGLVPEVQTYNWIYGQLGWRDIVPYVARCVCNARWLH